MIGDYLGILIFAPIALLWKQRQLPFLSTRRIPLDALISIALIVLLGVMAMQIQIPETTAAATDGPSTEELLKNSLRIFMILPAIALTYLHGWRGAAIGVAALNLIVGLTMQNTGEPGSFDANAFVAQEILAVAGTALLIFGSSISHYYRKFKHHDLISKHTVAAARINLISGDRALFDRVIRMEIIGDDIDTILRNAVKTMREGGCPKPRSHCRTPASRKCNCFVSSCYWPIHPALAAMGSTSLCIPACFPAPGNRPADLTRARLSGDPRQLSVELQVAAYRGICDAIHVLMEHEIGTIDVRARCGRYGSNRGIIINVSLLDSAKMLAPTTVVHATEQLMGRAFGLRRHRSVPP